MDNRVPAKAEVIIHKEGSMCTHLIWEAGHLTGTCKRVVCDVKSQIGVVGWLVLFVSPPAVDNGAQEYQANILKRR